jgi:hypothetical protein
VDVDGLAEWLYYVVTILLNNFDAGDVCTCMLETVRVQCHLIVGMP